VNKRSIIGLASAGLLLLGITVGGIDNSQSGKFNDSRNVTSSHASSAKTQPTPKAKPICDGTTVTTSCSVDGINYSTYIYHLAVPEKAHTETVTTYQKKVTGYCTLCNDGTYSPSCATGRGACSYHGGVQEWNAPEYSNAPVYSTNTVVDAPAQAAYYEKVAE
jgi:hypothetical protein